MYYVRTSLGIIGNAALRADVLGANAIKDSHKARGLFLTTLGSITNAGSIVN
jgi:hypothetical protein